MPLKNREDIGLETKDGAVCNFCIDSKDNVKDSKEIFEGGVQFFMNSVPSMTKDLAERITRKNMKSQPYWQNKDEKCLMGKEAGEEEFREALAKLHAELAKGNVKVV